MILNKDLMNWEPDLINVLNNPINSKMNSLFVKDKPNHSPLLLTN